MKTNTWLNEGYQVSLADVGAEILVNLSDKELKAQGITESMTNIAKTVLAGIHEQV